MIPTLIVGGLTLVAIIIILVLLQTMLIVVPPNRVLVISGRSRATASGDRVGYRVIRGGRAFRIPVLEKASWMDLTTIPLDLGIENAYSKGGIPLRIHAVANVKVNASEPQLSNAIERFLDVPREQLTGIVRDTLEGNLRGVVATLTPEEINEDRLRFAEALMEEAEHDLASLGIRLDTLKIQNVTDESGYLDSIGRRQTAEVLKEARIAEANRNAEASEVEAQAKQRATIAQTVAEQAILERQTELRIRRAELEAQSAARENEAQVSAERAKVTAEQQLEQERIILNQKRLEADIVAPARARREAELLRAQAEAAPIIEEGRARAEAVRQVITAFAEAGPDAERAYVLNMLPSIVDTFAESVKAVDIDRITVIDSGDGRATQSAMQTLPRNIVGLVEQVETATGVNLLGLLRDSGQPSQGAGSGPDRGPQGGGSGERPQAPTSQAPTSQAQTSQAQTSQTPPPAPTASPTPAEPAPIPAPRTLADRLPLGRHAETQAPATAAVEPAPPSVVVRRGEDMTSPQ
ncbi:band 7 protein [Deinococcus proteolyticus MRP]|uniref:Band 7 protein n=1 Tax=Deinococcus proteolyticus (strain ATCC 35074 / DSM 20540 / JCM 6276 / NBRC 101906 / NCIMB 13154 / VKM Ac-1939 / CCM 2703 / MRP) TaxID=693977 RepID=F0RN49_DEIPM|nr:MULTISPECIES: SPFH domain-containing protein [Deinococcus]ADY26191.1 band 7 protein [Deinococcus proteolyticus MRP]MCY1702311.1 SPFH domain-containing protein [Deinococcus sp. SL84]